jgi:hypothetical protein
LCAAPTWMRISRGRRMAPLESTLRLVGFGAHDCAPHAHLDADLRRTVAPFSRGRRMAPLESTRRSLSGTDETVGAFLAPTRRSEPFWHRRDGRSLSGTGGTVGAFLAPARRSAPFWHRRYGRSLSGTDETVGAYRHRRDVPFGQFGDMWTFWFCTPDLCARTYVGISYGRLGHASCSLQLVHRHFCDV